MEQVKHNISTIFFDAGGVLFDTEKPRVERIKSILKARGCSELLIAKGLEKGEEFSESYLKGGNWLSNWSDEEKYWDEYYEVILREIQKDFSCTFKKHLFHHTHYAIHCKLFCEVRALLESLQGNYKLGVISNALPSLDWVFDTLDIRKYFHSITISAFVGDCKPNEKIYKIALESLKVNAEECIFIDDKIKNVEAAERLGFTGIYLDRNVNDLRIIEPMLGINSLDSRKSV